MKFYYIFALRTTIRNTLLKGAKFTKQNGIKRNVIEVSFENGTVALLLLCAMQLHQERAVVAKLDKVCTFPYDFK